VLVLDQAGWHCAAALVVPEGVALVVLPAAAPELHPAERRWPAVTEPIATRVFPDLAALADTLVARCRQLRSNRPPIQALTRSRWWPTDDQSFAN
jgi:hypothetical protein